MSSLRLVVRRIWCYLPLLTACGSDDSVAPGSPRPTQIQVAEGNHQEGWVGEVLEAPLTVLVLDDAGFPLPGARISFSTTIPGAALDSVTVTSDANGLARTTARLATALGPQQFTASLSENNQVEFTATARGLAIGPSGRLLSGKTNSTCAIRSGTPLCWGAWFYGQSGSGYGPSTEIANLVAGNISFVAISPGDGHTCGLNEFGATWCWGLNDGGQAGVADPNYQWVPIQVLNAPTFIQIDAGWHHSCGLTGTGAAYCWGSNGSGELGDGPAPLSRYQSRPVRGGLTFASLTSGNGFTCGLTTSARTFCWGRNDEGQLGGGGPGSFSSQPVEIAGGVRFRQLSAGAKHVCGLDFGGTMYCWGTLFGSNIPSPAQMASGHYTSVASGTRHVCILTEQKAALCAGANEAGQLGTGDTISTTALVPVTGGHQFLELAGGDETTCGRSDAGELCWGRAGLLGDGSGSDHSIPVIVRGPVARIEVVSGQGQVAPAGTFVATEPTIRVLDAQNRPLQGVWVSFGATDNGTVITGRGNATFDLTDAQGIAGARWQLSTTPGQNQLRVEPMAAGVANNPIIFAATAQ